MDAICCPLQNDCEDYPAFFDQGVITARKDHQCCECGETISKSTKYEASSGKWGDEVQTFRTCLSCAEIRDHFSCGGGAIFGQLWSDLEENFFPDMKAGGPCFSGLSPEAIGRLFELRLKWLEDTAE